MMIDNYSFPVKRDSLLLYPDHAVRPFYSSSILKRLYEEFPGISICLYNPFFGLIPVEISDIYPASHNVFVKNFDEYGSTDYTEFLNLINSFLKNHAFKSIYIVSNKFMNGLIPHLRIPESSEVKIEDFDNFKIKLR
jgi:7-cyano-7-deazaguanine tRNA-ribosyltransferase